MGTFERFHWMHLLVWSGVLAGFLAVFLRPDTLPGWGDNPRKTLMLAILILIGYVGDLSLRYYWKRRGMQETAEEHHLRLKGLSGAFIAVLVYGFLFAITLYTRYEAVGVVPVGWLWFLAYSLVIAANLFSSAAILFLLRR